MVSTKAILIEDNRAVVETLTAALSGQYRLVSAGEGEVGLKLIKSEEPEIIILDLNLPDISGLEILEETRKIGVRAPILVLSGDSRLSTKLELFSAGADDYLVKPFSLGEFKARLSAMLRRSESYQRLLDNPRTDSLILDRSSESVIRDNGLPISLRHKEYAILEYLIRNAGKTVSRERLARYIWPNEPWSNTIDVHIKYLRDKIDKPFERALIKTVRGRGYRLETN